MKASDVLIKPILSEKANKQTEKLNRYSFVVDKKANKLEIKKAIEKTQEEERNSCENMISESNLQSNDKTIKTTIKYEKVKSDVSNYDYNKRIEFLQQLQIEDFNIAD